MVILCDLVHWSCGGLVWCFCSLLLLILEQDWHISEEGMLFHLIIKNHDQQHTPARPRSQGNKKSLLVCCSYDHIAAKQLWLIYIYRMGSPYNPIAKNGKTSRNDGCLCATSDRRWKAWPLLIFVLVFMFCEEGRKFFLVKQVERVTLFEVTTTATTTAAAAATTTTTRTTTTTTTTTTTPNIRTVMVVEISKKLRFLCLLGIVCIQEMNLG